MPGPIGTGYSNALILRILINPVNPVLNMACPCDDIRVSPNSMPRLLIRLSYAIKYQTERGEVPDAGLGKRPSPRLP